MPLLAVRWEMVDNIRETGLIVYCPVVVNVPVFESGGVEGLRFRHNEFVCVC